MQDNSQNILDELNVQRLPSLPHVLVDMLQACQANKVSFQELAAIISRDVAISARAVTLANSTFFNRGIPIRSLERALLVLGTDTIKTIVITASIQQFFSGFHPSQGHYLKHFWRRSLSCALIAKSIAILTSYPNPEEAYLTALLHNIGELVLATNFPEKAHQIRTDFIEEPERCKAEAKVFKIDHATLGSALIADWGLSEFSVDAIRFHHAPLSSVLDAHHLVKVIYLASRLSETGALDKLDALEAATSLFELNASLVNEIVSKIDIEVQDIAQSLGINIDLVNDAADQDKQISLAVEVRNIGLLQTAAGELNTANSTQELGRAFQSSLELLFGYNKSAVFWHDESSKELSYITPDHSDNVPLKFKLDSKRSVIARSGIALEILSTSETHEHLEQLPVIDQQVVRMLNADNMRCIPIHKNKQLFCVLVVGEHNHKVEPKTQTALLEYFAAEISLTCEKTLKHISNQDNTAKINELTHRVSEIAHEANNPLNIINNYLATLSAKLTDQKDVQEELIVLREEVERASHILLRLKDVQHSNVDQEPGVEINHEIKSLVTLYKSSLFLTSDITCSLKLDEELKRNQANRNCLRQILTNLIKNAVEAMPEGGKIIISTSGRINVNGSDFSEVLIEDTGPGVPSHILKSMFNPVPSTKGIGHSGLGLSITKNLVKEAKGTISCRSSDKGTQFQILLPTK
jgi:HD-like signal output (HDOD) protein/nitrogen-specific signal transduction histidine kinase